MVLLIHILIAVSSLIYTTYLFFFPSRSGVSVAQALVAATLISGAYLAFVEPATITHVCISGLIYLGLISVAIVAVQRKNARLSFE